MIHFFHFFQVPDGFTVKAVVPAEQLAYNVPRSIYIALEIDPDLPDYSLLSANFSSVTLKYTVKDCDPNTSQILDDEGYEFFIVRFVCFHLFYCFLVILMNMFWKIWSWRSPITCNVYQHPISP